MTKETWEDGDTVVYEYDNNDALGSVTDSATGITTRYFYDLSQRLAKYRETGTGLDHSVTYSYDARNNLRAHTEVINGTIRKSIFTYDTDNRVTQVYNSNSASCRNYSYNAFGMPDKQETYHGNNLTLTDYYVYRTPTEATVTGQVDQLHNVAAAYAASHFYSYDSN